MNASHKVTTTVHVYRFDIEDATEAREYAELCERLRALGLEKFATWSGFTETERVYRGMVEAVNGLEVEIETDSLFDNQVNTAPIAGVSERGLRLFDWKEDIYPNKSIKSGHWLEQTESLQRARRETLKCGYCGKQEHVSKGLAFCPHCIDSEYLKENDLRLTRLRPVAEGHKNREPLTAAESAELIPRYRQAQMFGATAKGILRKTKQREDIERDYDLATKGAKIKHDGLLWLLDRGFSIDNVIYYSHTDTFSFGWRKPLGDDEMSAWLDVMVEFPYRYQLVGVSRKVEG